MLSFTAASVSAAVAFRASIFRTTLFISWSSPIRMPPPRPSRLIAASSPRHTATALMATQDECSARPVWNGAMAQAACARARR